MSFNHNSLNPPHPWLGFYITLPLPHSTSSVSLSLPTSLSLSKISTKH